MTQAAPAIVSRVWNYAHVLRDDGLSYGDYVEELTYLLFLKMESEMAQLRGGRERIPQGLNWASLRGLEGDALQKHYARVLELLGQGHGGSLLGAIFAKAQSKLKTPAILRRLVDLIDREEWLDIGADVTGDIYEGLLERNAEDVKGGAGQYFTPRSLIRALVECVRPRLGETVCDPACGTGGFLLAAHEYLKAQRPNKDQAKALKERTLFGFDIVDSVVRLCAMNLYLHNIGGETSPVRAQDSLAVQGGAYYDVVLANPPFGKKSSITVIGEDGKAGRESVSYERNDFWTTTSNKQLNFLQHIGNILAQNGRAAVVVPDNVLFEGGAGETVRRRLLQQYDVHTLLRLPTGIFYAQGVKANVLFFDRKPGQADALTTKLWVYDLRTNQNFTLKTNPLRESHLENFVRCYNPEKRHDRKETERFKVFTLEELLARDKVNLDITWLKDDSLEDGENLPAPGLLAAEIAENLQLALEQFSSITEELGTA